jgi:hypothetical protein
VETEEVTDLVGGGAPRRISPRRRRLVKLARRLVGKRIVTVNGCCQEIQGGAIFRRRWGNEKGLD